MIHWVLPFRRKPLTPEQALENYIEKLERWFQAEKLVILNAKKTVVYANATVDYAEETALNVQKAIAKFAIVMTDGEEK